MILYHCDRCGTDVSPDKLYDVEVIFTPRGLDGGEDVDKEDRHWLGQACDTCADALEAQMKAIFDVPAPEADTKRPTIGVTTFGRSSLDVVATEGGKASIETKG